MIRRLPLVLLALLAAALPAAAQTTLVAGGKAQAVILVPPSPKGYVTEAAQELQKHLALMSGALVPIDTVGHEANYPGDAFVYVGASSAATAAGISLAGLAQEFYVVRTVGKNLYIVGQDGGTDDWTNLTGCQPGTMFGVYHLLSEVLGVHWLWPGDSGIAAPSTPTITVPALNITDGPAMGVRGFRMPRIGLYAGGAATYGSNGMVIPVLPASAATRTALGNDDTLWLRREGMGSRVSTHFGASETSWWTTYGKSHPEYFAVLPAGKSQPSPEATEVKLNVSLPAVWNQIVTSWQASGSPSSLNLCPNDSRSFCICPGCLAWDYPAQDPSVVYNGSSAQLGDRYAHFYATIANQLKALNPKAVVYGYAYDTYQNAPYQTTLPDNVALEYIPGAPTDVVTSLIAQTQANVLGWIKQGCTQMYLRPNWFLAAHAGPFAPIHRAGNHYSSMVNSGYILGLDSDSSCSSYASFGLYYYLFCRIMANPSLTPDQIISEYCSGFGSAAATIQSYFAYWENFIDAQADAGNTNILGYASCMGAYPGAYTPAVFAGAEQLLDQAEATLAPTETAARARVEFLRVACLHGRLTAAAIALVKPTGTLAQNPDAEAAMRAVLAVRDTYAGTFTLWREWMIDRESYGVTNMNNYWTSILNNPAPTPPVWVSAATAAGTVGTPFTFQLIATNQTSSYAASGLPAGLAINAATGVISGTPTVAGTASVTLGAANVKGTTQGAMTIAVTGAVAGPGITTQPASQTVAPGGAVVLSVTTSALAATYQWYFNGSAISAATGARLLVSGATAASAGLYDVVVSAGGGATTSSLATLTVAATTNPGRLINLSVLTTASASDPLTVGLVTGGSGTSGLQPLLIRGTGPALAALGVGNVLPDPSLAVISAGTAILANDNWGSSAANRTAVAAAEATTEAFPLTDPGSLDAALVASVPAGSYSVVISGQGGAAGNTLAEVYDDSGAPAATTPRLINLSSKTGVAAGTVFAAGFVIGGTTAETVLIRASGPTLTGFGVTDVMPDPTLQVYSGQTVIATNAGWAGDLLVTAAGNLVFAFPFAAATSLDSALVLTLPPGSYTAQCTSASGAPGNALIEIYEVP